MDKLDLNLNKWKGALKQNKEQFLICQDTEYLCGLVADREGNYNLINCECDEMFNSKININQEDPSITAWIHSHPKQVINKGKYANCPIYPLRLSNQDKKFCEFMKNGWLALGVEDGIAIFDCEGNILKTFENDAEAEKKRVLDKLIDKYPEKKFLKQIRDRYK